MGVSHWNNLLPGEYVYRGGHRLIVLGFGPTPRGYPRETRLKNVSRRDLDEFVTKENAKYELKAS